ncbi:hypothetical protein [Paenibacillus sp. B2(2019)]|uniref:hypothetical protein n=1 Tax=Paenibacillus sp. B2(2019) TaxID=2607754 RepID=UPI0011F0CFA5|nr:hypothetical protein [Paenibacillus sp. B2(2019)]KAA1178392.1 hypothetical protein PAENI_30145 [Paenibacillus sp. B2(2019)]
MPLLHFVNLVFVDVLFDPYTHVLLISGKEVPMTPEVLERFSEANEEFSSRALRVLAYAYKTVPGIGHVISKPSNNRAN